MIAFEVGQGSIPAQEFTEKAQQALWDELRRTLANQGWSDTEIGHLIEDGELPAENREDRREQLVRARTQAAGNLLMQQAPRGEDAHPGIRRFQNELLQMAPDSLTTSGTGGRQRQGQNILSDTQVATGALEDPGEDSGYRVEAKVEGDDTWIGSGGREQVQEALDPSNIAERMPDETPSVWPGTLPGAMYSGGQRVEDFFSPSDEDKHDLDATSGAAPVPEDEALSLWKEANETGEPVTVQTEEGEVIVYPEVTPQGPVVGGAANPAARVRETLKNVIPVEGWIGRGMFDPKTQIPGPRQNKLPGGQQRSLPDDPMGPGLGPQGSGPPPIPGGNLPMPRPGSAGAAATTESPEETYANHLEEDRRERKAEPLSEAEMTDLLQEIASDVGGFPMGMGSGYVARMARNAMTQWEPERKRQLIDTAANQGWDEQQIMGILSQYGMDIPTIEATLMEHGVSPGTINYAKKRLGIGSGQSSAQAPRDRVAYEGEPNVI